MASLQNPKALWQDPDKGLLGNVSEPWLVKPHKNFIFNVLLYIAFSCRVDNRMSILHIYYGSQSTVPKLRKRLYGATDLLGDGTFIFEQKLLCWVNCKDYICTGIVGGILGLCLGFSFLSGVEVVYFLTLRSMWKYCRSRSLKRRLPAGSGTYSTISRMFPGYRVKSKAKVVKLDADSLKVYAGMPNKSKAIEFNTISCKHNPGGNEAYCWTYN